MYYIYIAVLGLGFLRRSNSCIRAVVRAALTPQGGTEVRCYHKKNTIFRIAQITVNRVINCLVLDGRHRQN